MTPKQRQKHRRRAKRKSRAILAAQQAKPFTLMATAEIDLTAAAEGEAPKQPTFSILAYAGGLLRVWAYPYPIIVDLKGLRAERVAALKDHDSSQVVGQGEATIKAKSITLTGKVTGDIDDPSSAAGQVVAHARNGFIWAASVGVLTERVERIEAGETVKVNGRSWPGPIYVVRAGRLGEVSFVAVGADEAAHARLSAAMALTQEGTDMTFEQWLEGMGLTADGLSEEQTAKLQAKYAAEVAAAAEADAEDAAAVQPVTATATAPVQATGTPIEAADPVTVMRGEAADEATRIAAIQAVATSYADRLKAEAVADIVANGIRGGEDVNAVELRLLRAARPKAPTVITRDTVTGPKVVASALAMGVGLDDEGIIKAYGEDSLTAARRQFGGPIGAGRFILEAEWANGFTGRRIHGGNVAAVLRAAFSTQGASDILSNLANKVLLAAFMNVESVWRRIAKIRPVGDFKIHTHYRLTGDFSYVKIAPSGEIPHAVTADESRTNQAETYARMFVITRTDLVNDDLGAFDDLRKMLGRGAALKLNEVFWTAFLDNAAFFTGARGNYVTGAGTVLQSSSLSTVTQSFRDQTDTDGHPVGIEPRTLLVPTALETDALELFVSTNLNVGTSTKAKLPDRNIWANKYEPAVSAYLGNSAYTGYSQLAWYLLADPADMPVIEVVFLDGVETPTVESADADFDVLGVQIRGYHDFGVALAEFLGGVKSKGAA